MLREGGFLELDELHLKINAVTQDAVEETGSPKSALLHWQSHESGQLQHDIESLFEGAKHTDVVLAKGSKEIKAHRSIVSCRSQVFLKMFDSELEESKCGRVKITEVDNAACEVFVKFSARVP